MKEMEHTQPETSVLWTELKILNKTAEKEKLFLCSFVFWLFCGPLSWVVYVMNIRIRGPGSVVGIATAYGLDGPGIVSR